MGPEKARTALAASIARMNASGHDGAEMAQTAAANLKHWRSVGQPQPDARPSCASDDLTDPRSWGMW